MERRSSALRRLERMGLLALVLVFCSRLLAQTGELLVTNARFFTMADGQREPFAGYMLVDEQGRIAAIEHGAPPAGMKAKAIYDAHGEWIIPGFLSAHSHLWQAGYRGVAADKTLLSWIDAIYTKLGAKATPEDMYWFTLLGAVDHLQAGITGVYDFNYARIDWKGENNEFDEAQFRAEQAAGIRFVHGYEPGWWVPGVSTAKAEERLGSFLRWTKVQSAGTRLFSVMINGDTAFNNSYQQAVMEKALMDRFSLRNQTHYLEPPEPETQGEERAQFRWFMDSGLLSENMVFGHFIHTDAFILDQAVKHHVAMTWNPLSNGRMASGVADIPAYLKAGMRVGMGIDGEASGDLADPFENMRAGLYAVRDKYEDATVISPYQMLWLHTAGSADVLGVKDRAGTLEKGKFADFVVIDPENLGVVLQDPYANLVLVATPRDIDRVYVGGRLEVEAGKVLHTDVKAVQSQVRRRVAAAWEGAKP